MGAGGDEPVNVLRSKRLTEQMWGNCCEDAPLRLAQLSVLARKDLPLHMHSRGAVEGLQLFTYCANQ